METYNTTNMEFGLSQAQREALQKAGLSAQEINALNTNRALKEIQKTKSKLDKIEQEYKNGGMNTQEASEEEIREAIRICNEVHENKGEIPNQESKPWEDRDDLIMSNEEYWKEIDRVAPPSEEEKSIDITSLDPTDEEDYKLLKRYAELFYERTTSKATQEVLTRRQLGAIKAHDEWVKKGMKGKRPEGISDIFIAAYNPFSPSL